MKFTRVHLCGGLLLIALLLLLLLRVASPFWVRHYLDERIAHMGPYHGSMETVHLHIWRGGYTIGNLRVEKDGAPADQPFLLAPRTEITVSYGALLHGHLRGKVDFYDPTVNFIDGNTEGERQTGKGVNWTQALDILIPAQLDEIGVHHGTVTFHNFVSSPRVDLKMTDVNSTVTNLSNAQRQAGTRVATLHTTATVLGDAPLETNATFDPTTHFGDFDYHIHVTHIQLVRANDLARAYTGLDFAGGEGDFTMQLKASGGNLQGYAEPAFKNVQLFSWKKDVEQEKKGPLKLLYEAAAQGVVSMMKDSSQGKDEFVTRVSISGRIDDSKIGKPEAIVNVLHTSFAQAYKDQLQHLKPAPDGAEH